MTSDTNPYRTDPAGLHFERFTLVEALGDLLKAHAPSLFAASAILDADAVDASLLHAAPGGAQVVLASGFPEDFGLAPAGPAFDPAAPPFEPDRFHLVLAGPSVHLREVDQRPAALRGLVSMASGLVVLALPPSGALGEVGAEALLELVRARRGDDHAASRRARRVLHGDPMTPADIEEALEGVRCHVHYVPACDPAGGFVLSTLEHVLASVDPAGRLLPLLHRMHNLALVESAGRAWPLYQDLCLIFPGRSTLPRAVRKLLARQAQLYRPEHGDLSMLQLVLQLEELDRRRLEAAGPPAPPALQLVSPRRPPPPPDPPPRLPVDPLAELRRLVEALPSAVHAAAYAGCVAASGARAGAPQDPQLARLFEASTEALDRLDQRWRDAAHDQEVRRRQAIEDLDRRLERQEGAHQRQVQDLQRALREARARVRELEEEAEDSARRADRLDRQLADFRRMLGASPVLRAYVQKRARGFLQQGGGE